MSEKWFEIPARRQGRTMLAMAVNKLGASKANIPGLWNVPGYPELTTNQLLQIAGFTGDTPEKPTPFVGRIG